MNFLVDSVVTVKEAILKRWRRKRAPTRTEFQGMMFSDKGLQLPHQIYHKAIQHEDPLQKSMVASNDEFDNDDDDQETSSKKRKLDHDFSDPSSETTKVEMSELPSLLCDDSEEDDDQETAQKKRRALDDSLAETTNEITSNKKRKLDHDFSDPSSETTKVEVSSHEELPSLLCDDSEEDDDQETAEKKRKALDDSFLAETTNEITFNKKRKLEVTVESGTRKPLGEEVRMKILQKAEEDVKAVLVIEKVLRKSDILRSQSRLTIPLSQMEKKMFLSAEEIRHLRQMCRTSRTNHMDVPIIEPSGNVGMLALRRWNIGRNSVSYVFTGGWKDVVESNRLKQGQKVQVWAFRVRGQLNFAFVFLPK